LGKHFLADGFLGKHRIAGNDTALHRSALQQCGGDGYFIGLVIPNRHLPDNAGNGVAIEGKHMDRRVFGITTAAQTLSVHGKNRVFWESRTSPFRQGLFYSLCIQDLQYVVIGGMTGTFGTTNAKPLQVFCRTFTSPSGNCRQTLPPCQQSGYRQRQNPLQGKPSAGQIAWVGNLRENFPQGNPVFCNIFHHGSPLLFSELTQEKVSTYTG
jgi:hypothetical protein